MILGYFSGHHSNINAKQKERNIRISSLPAIYHAPLTAYENLLVSTPVSQLVKQIKKGETKPLDLLRAYGKSALKAHKETNCLTEIIIKDAEEKYLTEVNLDGPLAGIPVSVKDSVNIKGYDACIGYSSWIHNPSAVDSGLIRCLKDAGAVPFVKTNIPTCLLSFESYNDIWGRTTNPYNKDHSPGGSTGGESALLAAGGSIIGVGTDVAGSVRIPAHYCGSTGRFPRAGNVSNMPGQDGVRACYSPMTRSLPCLSYFLKAVIDQKPWNYDPSVDPIPWRDIVLPKKLKFGVMRDDSVVRPSPACARALQMTISAVIAAGHEVVDFNPPNPAHALKIAGQLLLADGGKTTMRPFKYGERNEKGLAVMMRVMRLPRWLKWIWSKIVRWRGDIIWADLIEGWGEKRGWEQQLLVVEREKYRAHFLTTWLESGIDFLLTVPNATPAVPHNGLAYSFSSCGYTFLFNLVDYPAGVFPVTYVDPKSDVLPKDFKPKNAIEKGAYGYGNYNPSKMGRLPVGVQLVGRRLEEETVLKGMEVVEEALRNHGQGFVPMKPLNL